MASSRTIADVRQPSLAATPYWPNSRASAHGEGRRSTDRHRHGRNTVARNSEEQKPHDHDKNSGFARRLEHLVMVAVHKAGESYCPE